MTELISILSQDNIMFIGGGSNLLINDTKHYNKVVCLREFCKDMRILKSGFCYIGASVRNQQAIKWINENGMGGIEYLASVPGLIGGAIFMNAGKGTKGNNTIGNYVVSVDAFLDGKIVTLDVDQCRFMHRRSVFQTNNGIILGATFNFPKQDLEDSKKKVAERLEYCRVYQDNSKPNLGSVFSKYNGTIIKMARLIGLKKGNIAFSKKTNNWILNRGNGTYSDAKNLIETVIKIHKFFNKEISTEVRVWD